MTRWPLWLAEIALYSVIAGVLIAMGLDARARWKQLREQRDRDERDSMPDPGGGAEVTAVRVKRGGAPGDTAPPPAA